MKILTTKFNQLVLLSIACILAASTPMKAQQVITHSGKANSGEMARLIVNRAANFGTEDSINLFVDGTQVAVIGYNESYDAPLPAGKHVLLITTNPVPPQKAPTPVVITAEPGKTYTFTADWPDSEVAGLVAN